MSRINALTRMGLPVVVLVLLVAVTSFAGITKNEGEFHLLAIKTAVTGESAVATITIKGKNVYHCNKAFPWKVQLKPSPGVTFEKGKYRKDDAEIYEEDKIVFKIPYKVTAQADVVNAFFKGSLCDNKLCQTVKIDFSWPAK